MPLEFGHGTSKVEKGNKCPSLTRGRAGRLGTMRRFFSRIFALDSAYSVADRTWTALVLLFPSAGAAMTGWLWSEVIWLRETAGWAGVVSAAIVAFFLLSAGSALIIWAAEHWVNLWRPPPPVDWSRIDHFEEFTCLQAACYLYGKYPAHTSASQIDEAKEPEIYQYIREFAADRELTFYEGNGQIDAVRRIGGRLKRPDLDAHFARKSMKPEFLDRGGRAAKRSS